MMPRDRGPPRCAETAERPERDGRGRGATGGERRHRPVRAAAKGIVDLRRALATARGRRRGPPSARRRPSPTATPPARRTPSSRRRCGRSTPARTKRRARTVGDVRRRTGRRGPGRRRKAALRSGAREVPVSRTPSIAAANRFHAWRSGWRGGAMRRALSRCRQGTPTPRWRPRTATATAGALVADGRRRRGVLAVRARADDPAGRGVARVNYAIDQMMRAVEDSDATGRPCAWPVAP